jgi:hypothetical protein
MSTNSPGRILAAARDKVELMFGLSSAIALLETRPELEAEVTVDGDPLSRFLERIADRRRDGAA